jgi:hypothetical protein
MPETVVMVATSYPRFAGDIHGTFMEPIARGLAARGHAVHVVLPWHPKLTARSKAAASRCTRSATRRIRR